MNGEPLRVPSQKASSAISLTRKQRMFQSCSSPGWRRDVACLPTRDTPGWEVNSMVYPPIVSTDEDR
jgi:hypothetical protein